MFSKVQNTREKKKNSHEHLFHVSSVKNHFSLLFSSLLSCSFFLSIYGRHTGLVRRCHLTSKIISMYNASTSKARQIKNTREERKEEKKEEKERNRGRKINQVQAFFMFCLAMFATKFISDFETCSNQILPVSVSINFI
jgi:hypothetical protein